MAAPLPALIPLLRTLLETGYATDTCGAMQLLRYVAHPVAEGAGNDAIRGWIVSQRLLAVRPYLSSNEELVCVLLAQDTEVRSAWLGIAASRCHEAGQMADPAPLLELVSGLQQAASWVEAVLPSATLVASPYAMLERELLNTGFEQAAATPALIRILAVTAQLAQFDDALPVLPRVNASGTNAQQNWVKGRLLALPVTDSQKPAIADEVLLHGRFAAEAADAQSAISWVLSHPWPLFLAMLVFAQDTWRAESRGGLLLELPTGQNAFSPAEIAVTVVGTEGDEIRCGSLAELLLKTLASLGVACFPGMPSVVELNAQLSPLVGLLLNRQIWRYQDGASGQLGHYQIHPLFADESYRLPSSKVFNRTGKLLWQALRLSAEALYQEHKHAYRRESAMTDEELFQEETYS